VVHLATVNPDDLVCAEELDHGRLIRRVLLNRWRVEIDAHCGRGEREHDTDRAGDALLLATHVFVQENENDEGEERDDRDDRAELILHEEANRLRLLRWVEAVCLLPEDRTRDGQRGDDHERDDEPHKGPLGEHHGNALLFEEAGLGVARDKPVFADVLALAKQPEDRDALKHDRNRPLPV